METKFITTEAYTNCPDDIVDNLLHMICRGPRFEQGADAAGEFA